MKVRRLIVVLFGLLSCFRGMPAEAVETTIYVGKHLEVRDHDAPVKYVFNGSTRVARITGSLSTNTRIQRFRLHPGWNLLSLAVSATNLSDQLQSLGLVASAHSWNAQTGSYSPVPQVAPSGMVLWVNATTNATLSVVGAYVDPVNREVSAGTTYLASTGLEAWTPNFPATLSAWHFSPQPGVSGLVPFNQWRSRLTGDLSSVNDLPQTFPPGQALYVINQAPFELEIADPALRVRYYQQDHLGSSSAMTDAGGALVEEAAFYPFGMQRHEHRPRQIEEPYKFTQKERDRETGLHYFEARFLTGVSGRFISVDPKYAALETATPDPQQLNVYAYARNNPVLYVDPTGLDSGVPEVAESVDEIDVDTTVEAVGNFLGNTWLGGMIKAPPKVKDAASFSGGFGDAIVDPLAKMGGVQTMGMGFGQFTRMAFGINNVDTSSPDYAGGSVLGTAIQFAIGAGELKAAISGLGGAGAPVQTGVIRSGAGRTGAPIAVQKTHEISPRAFANTASPPVAPRVATGTRTGGSTTIDPVRAAQAGAIANRHAILARHNGFIMANVQAYQNIHNTSVPIAIFEAFAKMADDIFGKTGPLLP